MKYLFLILIAALIIPAMNVQAVGDNWGTDSDCMEYAVPNVALTVNAGNIIFCARYPHFGVPYSNSVFNVGATLSGPVITAVGGATTAITITAGTGCTAGASTTRTGLAALGVAQTVTTTMTMTGPICTGKMRGTTTLLAGTVISDTELPFTVYAQDTIKNSVEIGCGEDSTYQITSAPAIITDCADTAESREIDEWRSDMCDNPAGHGHCELHIHGGLNVNEEEACGAVTPCLIGANITVNQSGNFTSDNGPVFEPSLYILLVSFAAILAFLGESRKDNNYRVMAGGIMLLAAFVKLWELDRLGFNNLGEWSLSFALGFMIIEGAIGLYLLFPKNYAETETK